MGTGAFVDAEIVKTFLKMAAVKELSSEAFHLADMYFSTFFNQHPYQLENGLIELSQDFAFSGQPNGIMRNKQHIVCNLNAWKN